MCLHHLLLQQDPQNSSVPARVQSVKTLIASLWSPTASHMLRAEAADLVRRKSLTHGGLEEVRHVAGLESLIKLAEEGPPAEKARV
jgi:hypothetical protein